MKNLIWMVFGAVVFAMGYAVFAGAPATAGLFDQLATSDWPTKKSEAYKVDAYGFDFRVYEWQTTSDPNTFCTVAIGNEDRAPYMGLDCFQKNQ